MSHDEAIFHGFEVMKYMYMCMSYVMPTCAISGL